tara:strand:- start:1558 stop:1797 length:240 start_codon:yes stop_codon:yes gene_type:complete
MRNIIDFVITNLEVDIQTDNNNMGRVSFVFIDQSPSFPKVQKMLNQIDERPDAYVNTYSISTIEIDETTDLRGLEFTKH